MPSILNTGRDLERLRQIVSVLWKHGFGELVTRTGLGNLLPGSKARDAEPRVGLGERIRLVLQDLGPSFIKLGQIASTRPDLLPVDVIEELKKLQDNVPSEGFEEVRRTVESDLGATIEEIYAEFEETPMASASIGQVHRAKLRMLEGLADVVVKVQRSTVRDVVQRDIDLLYWFAHAVERSIPELRLYQPVKMVGEFDRAITAELDYVQEADNAERFARNFEGIEIVKFPGVYRQACAKRVLTLEFLDGKKIYDAIAAGTKGEVIARKSVEIIVKQMFEDGFFHADPHPGNVLIMGTVEEPIIGLVDLGMVGRLTPTLRDRTIDLMVAAVREDYRGIADALYALSRPTRKIDRDEFETEVTLLSQKYLGKKLQDIEMAGLIRDLANGARKYGLEVPADFLMLGKSLMTVEGVGKEIFPELDLFEEVRPYFLRLLQARYSPERMSQDAMRGFMKLSAAATDMPVQMQEILDDLRKGSFRLEVRESSLREAADTLGRRIFSGLLLMGFILAGGVLFAAKEYWPAGITVAVALAYAFAHRLGIAWERFRSRGERG